MRSYFSFLSLLVLFSSVLFSQPLLRFPDIHENTVVFVSGEDIWKAPLKGGPATRLTMHDGSERYPSFSPDGSLIAFTGEYDGNADVYVMDVYGGHITRLTYHPGNDEVIGWHPTQNKILFSSSRNSFRSRQLFLINPDGTDIEQLIMHQAADGAYSPDGSKIVYVRDDRLRRTWKRYKGGTAENLYLFDFTAQKDHQLTTYRGTDRQPMWIGDKIYFTSDSNRVLNIFSYDPASGTIQQVTHHSEYDVRRPNAGGNSIVYELGGELYVLDVTSGQSRHIPIEIRSDLPELRPFLKEVKDNITQVNVSPDGKTALVAARGEIFTVPKEGRTFNRTSTSGAREKDPVFSPDGKQIAYFSDQDGEYNLYIMNAAHPAPARKLTSFKSGYRHTLRWSPDGKWIAFTDQTLTLYYIDVAGAKLTRVDKAEYENIDVSLDVKPIYDFNWSPDSRYLAYSKMDASLVNKLYIYDLKNGRATCISEGHYNEFHPVFSTDGEHLFFISNRRFDPVFCDFEWEMVYKKLAGIYSYTLRKDGPRLFPVGASQQDEKDKKKSAKKPSKVVIDFDGLTERIESFPLPRGNYRRLQANESTLFYLNREEGDFNRFEFRTPKDMDLHAFSFADKKENLVIKKINSYQLSEDGTTIVYRKDAEVGLIESTARESSGGALDLSGLKMQYEPLAEWRQIFNEAWRMERDFYYEPDMHGLDWPAMKIKYGRMLERATCRQDVRYVIGELIGELNTSHTYVYGGDRERKADRVNVGLLGADFTLDKESNRYRFKKIYREAEWTRDRVPPLYGPGMDVQEGDYLLAVDGQEITGSRNFFSFFIDLAGKEVTITVNKKPTLDGARELTVKPVNYDGIFRYLDWVENNRKIVEKESNGRLGYLHLPDTYTGSARIFPKYYYSQTTREGIIVDGRFNGGGLDPDIFLQRLDKKPMSYWTRRYSHDYATPWLGNNAHLVCLTNRQAGSGGDELPYLFRQRGMGPVIGTRSWGGLVGVSMFISLIDGGGLSAPDYRIYNTEGKWVVENEGVTPDIEIDLDPVEMSRGYDAQLMKAIEVLMKKINREPRPWPKHEDFPKDR